MSETIIIAENYNGLPLAPQYLTYVMEDLDASIEYMKKVMHGKKTIMACVITIHTDGHDLMDTIEGEQSRIDKMICEFGKLTYAILKKTYPRNHSTNKPCMAGFWKSIFYPKRQSTFKLVLMLDTDLYYIAESEKDPQDFMKERLIESWASVSNLSISTASDQMNFSSDFAKNIMCNSSGMEVLFPTISQLCTDDLVPGDVPFACFEIKPYKPADCR